MSLKNIIVVADKFEKILKKAQETTDIYEFQSLLDGMFPQAEKNKIANQIANSIDEDLATLKVSAIFDKVKGTIFQVLVNGMANPKAQGIVNTLKNKIDTAAKSKNITVGKYDGWIKYPK